jgi:hypothetical protein
MDARRKWFYHGAFVIALWEATPAGSRRLPRTLAASKSDSKVASPKVIYNYNDC